MRRYFQNKKRLAIGGFTLVMLVMFMFIWAKQSGQTSGNSNSNLKGQVAVDVYKVERKDLTRNIAIVGQTVADAQIDIAAKYSGRVMRVAAKLGQKVSAGDTLIVQDTGDIELSIAQNKAELRQSEADTIEAQATYYANYQKLQADYQRNVDNYNRYKSLFEMGAVSREALDNIQQQMVNAKAALDIMLNQSMKGTLPASVESKQAAVEKNERYIAALAKQRDDLIIKAPREGVIVYRQVEEGSYVSAGQKLMSLVDNSKLFVDCQLSESDAAHVLVGTETSFSVEAIGKIFPAKVIFISSAKDASTYKYLVRLAISNNDPMLKSGMYARAALNVILSPQALVILKDAVQTKNGKYYVFVLNEQNQVEERQVQVGLSNDSEIEIVSGLTEKERIAASNLGKLRSGMTVVINKAEGQSSPGGANRQGGTGR